MQNFIVWICLISTAAFGVAVAQPTTDTYAASTAIVVQHQAQV